MNDWKKFHKLSLSEKEDCDCNNKHSKDSKTFDPRRLLLNLSDKNKLKKK